MIFVASPADVAPSNVTSGTMTTTTILRTLGRRHAGEPRVVQRLAARRERIVCAVPVLPATFTPWIAALAAVPPSRDHAHHRLAKQLQLVGRESDLLRRLGCPRLIIGVGSVPSVASAL